MRLPRIRFTLRRLMIAVMIVSLITVALVELARRRQQALRDAEIQRALVQSLGPPGWWPVEWRQEFDASLTIGGQVSVAGKPVGADSVSFILSPGDRVFSGKIDQGRHSLKRGRMPTGLYRIEVRSDDGPEPRTIRSKGEMPMDRGFHRMNLAY